jgi:hypothetical protein
LSWRLLLALAVLPYLLATESIAQDDDWVYRVRPGDNLWTLTDKHLKNLNYVDRLQTLNQIANPYLLPPGTRLRIPLRWLRRQSSGARVVVTGGNGTLLRANDGATVPISAGLDIAVGDSLSCPTGSYATLEFADGLRLRVQAESRIQLDAAWVYGDAAFFESEIALQRGRAESEVPATRPGTSRLRVRTPAATTSVRGTRFRVSADAVDSSSRSEVLRGQVGVSARPRVVPVAAGAGPGAKAGAAPAPPQWPCCRLPISVACRRCWNECHCNSNWHRWPVPPATVARWRRMPDSIIRWQTFTTRRPA